MQVTIIPIGVFVTVTKGLLKGLKDLEIGGQVETYWKLTKSKKELAIPADSREVRISWNMRVTEIPIVVGALGSVSKILERGLERLEIEEQIETIQITALLWSARILR